MKFSDYFLGRDIFQFLLFHFRLKTTYVYRGMPVLAAKRPSLWVSIYDVTYLGEGGQEFWDGIIKTLNV